MKKSNVIIAAAICGFFIIFSISILCIRHNSNDYDWQAEYLKELELKFSGIRSDLVDEVQNYIDSVAPCSNLRAFELVNCCEQTNIDIKFALAQGEIESHFGTKGLAAKTNSVWNVGAFDGYELDKIKVKYKNPNQSIMPYLNLLNRKYLVNKIELDLLNKYESVDGLRYASDKYYEERLRSKYDYIANKTKIGYYCDRLNYYKVRLGK